MEFLYPLFDDVSKQAALDQTLYILRNRPAGNCSARAHHNPGVCTNDEPMFQTKLVVNLANYTANRTLFCESVDALWLGLDSVYTSADFKDDLVWTGPATTGYGFTDSILKSGHHLFDSVLHAQVLGQLADMAERWSCGNPAPMRAVRQRIVAALQGPLLWNESAGMFRPSSGECSAPPCGGDNSNLTDVWGSALAVDTGAVTGERAARIIAWFGQHWSSVVQDGQIRHLPAIGDESGMPAGQYWPNTTTWQFGTYANGGYWGEASGWVLPVIGRANHELGQRLVRDAIAAAQRDGGLSEWQNIKFCCNCQGAAAWTGLCMTPYPSTASLRGASRYGRSVFAVYSAAKRLLGPAATGKPPRTVALPAEPEPAAPLTLHAQATAAMAAKQLAPGVDPDVAWLTEYATMYQAQARECTVRAILLERSLPLLR